MLRRGGHAECEQAQKLGQRGAQAAGGTHIVRFPDQVEDSRADQPRAGSARLEDERRSNLRVEKRKSLLIRLRHSPIDRNRLINSLAMQWQYIAKCVM